MELGLRPTEGVFRMEEVERRAESLIAAPLSDPDRWILILDGPGPPVRYVQLLAPEDGNPTAAVTEAVSDQYLEPGDSLARHELRALGFLGWGEPALGGNYRIASARGERSVRDIYCLLISTMQLAFGFHRADRVHVKLFSSSWRSPTRGADVGSPDGESK